MRRDGFAMPAVLALLVLAIPVVFALSVRSRAAIDWYQKIEDQKKAVLLAEEGEAAARAALRSGGPPAGNRRVPRGGMEYRVHPLAPGDIGQRQFLLIAEGQHDGEDRMVVSHAEQFDATLILEHDRSFKLTSGGGELVTPEALAAELKIRIEGYVAQLARESATTPTEFLSKMREQGRMLSCPDIQRDWAAIEPELARAKCVPN